MNEKIIFKCDFYDLLIEKILNRLRNFIRYNPDDLNRSILKKIIEGAISEITKLPIDEIDKKFESYAKIRLYSEGIKGCQLKTSYYNIFIPDLNIDTINQSQAESCYAKAFFSKMNEILRDVDKLKEFINQDDVEKLKDILNKCTQYATYALIYRISKQKIPSREELEKFMK